MNEQPPQSPGADVGPDRGGGESAGAALAATRRQLEESERRLALSAEREKLLRNEVQHRVRNMLATVRSIFARTADSSTSLEDARDHFLGRLDALARFQVARSVNAGGSSDLENIIRDELRSFEFDDRVEVAGPEVALPHDVAEVLGLAIHELTTNAIKFGALSSLDERFRLAIRWTFAHGVLELVWRETGVPVLASAPIAAGFGREFIEQALPYQTGAATTFALEPGGLSCTIRLSLRDGAERKASSRNWI
jgi:two-component system CheB/CheR fusion protein